GKEYHYLIYRDEGAGPDSQIVVVYDKKNTVTCEATLTDPGSTCTKWNLDGTSVDWSANFDGTTISNISLAPGGVAIFEVMP
ncbi:MAG: hypothetical protein OEV33_06205, partial [Armatimonadota bacterium]|nr:hypothetical protein [Armatimonadota bacterium]